MGLLETDKFVISASKICWYKFFAQMCNKTCGFVLCLKEEEKTVLQLFLFGIVVIQYWSFLYSKLPMTKIKKQLFDRAYLIQYP